jgi:hypothetical protein
VKATKGLPQFVRDMLDSILFAMRWHGLMRTATQGGASTNMNPLPRCVRFKLHRPHNARATWPRGPGSISSPLYPKTRMRMSSKSLVWTSPGNSRDCTSAQLELDLFYETHK